MKTILVLGDTESSRNRFIIDAMLSRGYDIIFRTYQEQSEIEPAENLQYWFDECSDSVVFDMKTTIVDYASDNSEWKSLRKPKPYYRMKEKW